MKFGPIIEGLITPRSFYTRMWTVNWWIGFYMSRITIWTPHTIHTHHNNHTPSPGCVELFSAAAISWMAVRWSRTKRRLWTVVVCWAPQLGKRPKTDILIISLSKHHRTDNPCHTLAERLELPRLLSCTKSSSASWWNTVRRLSEAGHKT